MTEIAALVALFQLLEPARMMPLWPRIHLEALIMMGRPQAYQHSFSTPSGCVQIIPPSLSLSPPMSSQCGTHPGVFITLVISCCSVSTFPELVELLQQQQKNGYQISYLSPDPLLSALLPPSSLCPAVWEDCTGFWCHTSRAGSGFSHGAYTCANSLTLCLSKAVPPWGQPWNVADRRVQQENVTFFCFVFIVSVPIFTWPNTKKHCYTGACRDPEVSCYSCSLFLLGLSCGTHAKADIFASM